MTTTHELSIVCSLRASKAEGLQATKDHFGESLYRTACGCLHCREDAQEAVQDVLHKLWKNREKVKAGKLEAYLFTIARRHLLDLAKKKAHHEAPLEPLGIDPPGGMEADAYLKAEEMKEQLKKAIQSMPPRMKAVFEKILEGYDAKDIAKKLGLSRNAIRIQISKGRKQYLNHYKSSM